MAVILFRKGSTTRVNGIPCEIQICNEYSYLHLLEQGWHYTPEECYAKEKQEIDDKATPGETLEETETQETEEEAEIEIKATAKKTGKRA